MKLKQLCHFLCLTLICSLLGGQAAATAQQDGFRAALSPTGQASYDLFAKETSNLMAGQPIEITSLLSIEGWRQTIALGWQSADFVEVLDGLSSLYYENPDLFFLEPRNFYFTSQEQGSRIFFTHPPAQESYLSEPLTPAQIAGQQKQLQRVVFDYVEKASRYPTTKEKIAYVYRRLTKEVRYDESFSRPHIHDAYGALVKGYAVCDGYALALKAVLQELGIPTSVVRGDCTATLVKTLGVQAAASAPIEERMHMWNVVQLDGSWYLLDAAWESAELPVVRPPVEGEFRFFLRGSESRTHEAFTPCALSDKSTLLPYPTLAAKDAIPQVSPPAQSPAETLPSFPTLDNAKQTDYPEVLTDLPFEYQIYDVPAAFRKALSQLTQNEKNRLPDQENFFALNDFVLYYTIDSFTGPSQIRIELPSGEAQPLFTSTQPIMSLAVWDEKTLAVELAHFVHLEGYVGQVYLLDLESGTLSPISGFETGGGHAFFYQLYQQNLYIIAHSPKAKELGEAYDVFRSNSTGEPEPLLDYAPQVQNYDGRFYYLKGDDRSVLLSADLSGKDVRIARRFAKPLISIQITHGKLRIDDESGSYVTDLAGTIPSIPASYNVAFTEAGFFCRTDDGLLEFVTYTGVRTPLMTGLPLNTSLTVTDDHLYFRIYQDTRICYFKSDLDGSNIVLLND